MALSGTTTGTGKRGPDLIAPGVQMVSLRDPGSFIDLTYKSTGAVSDTLFRGSGTSQAAAVMSGAVALLLQQHPELTPDQVKRMLMATAANIGGTVDVRGAGELNLGTSSTRPRSASTLAAPATGTGTLEGSRGKGWTGTWTSKWWLDVRWAQKAWASAYYVIRAPFASMAVVTPRSSGVVRASTSVTETINS
jgi:subtilisin family serine protease